MTDHPPSISFGRLRQLCRRGTRELDLLLGSWLENHYRAAEPNEQQLFQRLLEMEDSQLEDMLIHRRSIDDGYRRLIDSIRTPIHAQGGESSSGV